MRQSWRMWANHLDVNFILDQPEVKQVSEATTFGNNQADYRISRVAWLTDNEIVKSAIRPFAEEAAPIIGTSLGQLVEVQYTEYHATEGGKYDWHHDINWNENGPYDRKLSLTIQLSDPSEYEGGFFEFMEVEQPPEVYRTKGTILIFPSYLQHRVTPVTRGIRRSLVAWFHGPRWS